MQITTFSKALSDEIRVRLLAILLDQELSVGEVVQVLEMSQPRISRHLKILLESGLVKSRREGLWNFYTAKKDDNAGRYIDSVSFLFAGDEFTGDRRKVTEILAQRNREVSHFFDEIAEDWDRLQREIFGSFDLNAEILSRISNCVCGADLGCGSGALLQEMLKKCGTVIGVDNSRKMLQLAGQQLGDQASLRIGTLEHLPLRDEECDVAIISMVLHHLPSPEKAIAEVVRILKPGGKLIVADFAAHNNEYMRTRYGDRRLGFTEEQTEKLFSGAGLNIEKKQFFSVNKGLVVMLWISEKKTLSDKRMITKSES